MKTNRVRDTSRGACTEARPYIDASGLIGRPKIIVLRIVWAIAGEYRRANAPLAML